MSQSKINNNKIILQKPPMFTGIYIKINGKIYCTSGHNFIESFCSALLYTINQIIIGNNVVLHFKPTI